MMPPASRQESGLLEKLLRHGLRFAANAVTSLLLPPLARWKYGGSLKSYQPNHLLHVGNQYLFQNRIERALEFYLAAFDKDPESRWVSGAHLLQHVNATPLKTDVYFSLLKSVSSVPGYVVPDLEKALLLNAIERDPDRLEAAFGGIPRGRLGYKALEALGSKALGIGRNRLGLDAFQQALLQRPNNPVLLEQIGVTEFLTGLYPNSESSFTFADFQKELERSHLGVADSPYAILDRTWLAAIGHVAFLDTYIKACMLGWYSAKKSLLIYEQSNPPAGWPLFKFFSKHIEIVATERKVHQELDAIVLKGVPPDDDDRLQRMRVALTRPFWYGPDGDGRIRWYGPFGAAVETAWKEQGRQALFALDQHERKSFRRLMKQLYGLPEDAWFILLHVREPGFHSTWHEFHAGTRNADIKSYDAVIDFVRSKGGWVIRGGDASMTPLEPREGVIDYATGAHKHPALDIYLCAECAYFVGTNSGFSLIPPVFGKKCALTNWSPIAIPNWYLDDLYIPKLVRKVSEGRHLSFKEMYASFTGWSQFMRDFKNTDFVIEDNTPEDLRDLAEELHEQVFGLAAEAEAADEQRLQRFNAIATANGSYVGSQMGRRFLNKYAHLLDDPAGLSAADVTKPEGRIARN
ncbi:MULTISPECIES: TIGR04372 family glycosyltransferase [unclassified Bradyrhizobium]|uniref:TIGR04372 family glycosyltransferase n=1 Tax=unclassified Bradyrhizobium TaxID=2631580 RepID=UPI00291700F0|nr:MULTISPECIES: TIGR04372 family glycosyltransferase [unclassified Bradyrhizobium]